MSINKDPEFFKLLIGIIGFIVAGVSGLFLKLFFGLKDTINIIFHRLNSTDHRVTKMEARYDERHKRK